MRHCLDPRWTAQLKPVNPASSDSSAIAHDRYVDAGPHLVDTTTVCVARCPITSAAAATSQGLDNMAVQVAKLDLSTHKDRNSVFVARL